MKTVKIIGKDGKNLLSLDRLEAPQIIVNGVSKKIDELLQGKEKFTVIPSEDIQDLTPIDEDTPAVVSVGSINDTEIFVPNFPQEYEIVSGEVYFDNLQSLIEFGGDYLEPGNVAVTKGFYFPGDGGGSRYYIRSSITQRVNQYSQEKIAVNKYSYYTFSQPLVDGVSLIELSTSDNSTLYADLQILEGQFVNLRQMGGRPLEDGVKVDNNEFLQKAITFIYRKKFFRSIYIPSGHWCLSPLILEHQIKTGNGYVGLKLFGNGNNTVLMPYENSQSYIIRVGTFNSSPALYESRGSNITDLAFQAGKEGLPQKIKDLYGEDKYLTTAALLIKNSTYSDFDRLSFNYIYNTALSIESDYETRFGYLKFHCCGGVRNGVVYHVVQLDRSSSSYASSVSANWMRLFHFDSCCGPLIYGGAKNCVHNEFNSLIISGSSAEYNEACPDTLEEQPQEYTTVRWGVIDGWSGMSSYWPNLYNSILCSSFDNSCYRKNSDGSYTMYKMNSIIHFENSAFQQNTQLGNIAMKLESGKYATYCTQTGIRYSVKQLYDESQVPFYVSSQSLPYFIETQKDPRLFYGGYINNKVKYSSTYNKSPFSLVPIRNSASDQNQFIARKGVNYALRIYKTAKTNNQGAVVTNGTYWLYNADSGSGYKNGLSVYYNGGWKKVGNVVATDSNLIGSNGNWRYVTISNFFCFPEDTLVRVDGAIDFFYEYKVYPQDKIKVNLSTNNMTFNKNTSNTYSVTILDPNISDISASVSKSSSFAASYNKTGKLLTVTASTANSSTTATINTVIRLTCKDANGNVITRTSFIVSQPKKEG